MFSLSLEPENIDQWFSPEQQSTYVALLMNPANRPVGLTRCRAEYFVRLWAYLLLKQQGRSGRPARQSLARLSVPEGFISCTHRETARVFYGDKERGSDRAAAMILNKLAALGLLDKEFDGNTICLQINPRVQLIVPDEAETGLQFKPDAFDPRTDAILVANFLARNYHWMNSNTSAVPHRIAGLLRQWARQYPTGMRVLRRCDNLNPIGFYLFYPTAPQSERNFFLPPRMSLHLSSNRNADPIAMAEAGDCNCTSIFVRSWTIDRPYMQLPQIRQFLQDSQQTLKRMQQDFPNSCDLYTLTIHPILEKLAAIVGFQKTHLDVVLGISWLYCAIDRFLALDLEKALWGAEFLAG